MPRDGFGQVFGIGSIVKTPKGQMTVQGFAAAKNPRDIRIIQKAVEEAGYRAYNWRQVKNTNSHEKANPEHVDCCPQDVRSQVQGIGAARESDDGDKVVWGD